MPIKDLQTAEYGFPEAGRIRLGIKKVNKKGVEYPVETDYFVLSDAMDLVPHYGQQPKELLVFLPYQERDRNFRAFYELFKTGGLYCQGDGEFINWQIDPAGSGETVIRDGHVIQKYTEENGESYADGSQVPCSGRNRKDMPLYQRCTNCRARAILFVLIRDPKDPLKLVGNRLAYYRISTGSIHNIIGLTESLNTFAYLAAGFRKGLAGIPLILRRTERTMSVNTKNKDNVTTRSQVTKHFLAFEADPIWSEVASLSIAAQALNKPVDELLALPDGIIDADELDTIDGEGMYVPEELDDLDERLANRIADLEAMKDELPTDWPAYHDIMGEIFDKYSPTDMVKLIRKRLGIGRTQEIALDKRFWNETIDCVIETLRIE